MAHWAEIDENNVVIRVLVGSNDEPDEGHQWLIDNLGGTWVKTSYNGNIRKNFAGKGYVYDEDRDAFIAPKLFESWVLNEETCQWEPPVASPAIGYYWDEETVSWVMPESPYPSWTWDENDGVWRPPIPVPSGDFWIWDEDSQSWIEKI